MEDEDYITKEDEKFLDNPTIKINYGINNKKTYFESDAVYDYIIKIRKENHTKNQNDTSNRTGIQQPLP